MIVMFYRMYLILLESTQLRSCHTKSVYHQPAANFIHFYNLSESMSAFNLLNPLQACFQPTLFVQKALFKVVESGNPQQASRTLSVPAWTSPSPILDSSWKSALTSNARFAPTFRHAKINIAGLTPTLAVRWIPILAIWGIGATAGLSLYLSDMSVYIPCESCQTNGIDIWNPTAQSSRMMF